MSPRRNEVVAIAGYRRVTRLLSIALDPVRAAKLAVVELRTGMTGEQIISAFLDDVIFDMAGSAQSAPAKASANADISSTPFPPSQNRDQPSAPTDETSTERTP